MIPKMYDTCIKVSGIGNNIFNPIYENGDKITPDINPNAKCSYHFSISEGVYIFHFFPKTTLSALKLQFLK